MLRTASISSSRAFSILLWISLSIWILLVFLQKTNLMASDLGRHIMNGKIITESGQVFQKNLYSYTHQNFPAPNHHWLFGVVTYQLYQMGGFSLITVIVAAVYWSGIMLMLWLTQRLTTGWITLAVAFVFLPIMGMRTETRPEAFSVLGMSLTILICHWLWIRTATSAVIKAAAFLFVVMLLWVNFHILFIFGLLVTGCYVFFAFISRSRHKIIIFSSLLLVQIIAAMLNPLGWRTLIYPLQIMQDYRYPVAENQSVLFFLRYHPSIEFYYLAMILLLTSLAIIFTLKKVPMRLRPVWLLTGMLFFATVLMHRFVALFQLPAFIVLAYSAVLLARQPLTRRFFSPGWLSQPFKVIAVTLSATLIVGGMLFFNLSHPSQAYFGAGVLPRVEAAGDFFKTNGLPGPIFNNYDIGGYLIFKLYPKQTVFVDNRPEAYPGSFMVDQYIDAQKNEASWRQLEETYRFNSIFFYRHDATDWAQAFLIRRITDESWAPVYADDYSVILVKNTPENQSLIATFKLPETMFTIE